MPSRISQAADSGTFQVAGLGEILWDLLPRGRQLGGAPANFAYHAAQLGLDAWIVSSVGADSAGEDIARALDALGVRRDVLAVSPRYPTGAVDVRVDENGEPEYNIRTDVAWDHIPWSRMLERLAGRLQAVCFGALAQRSPDSRATIRRFLEATAADCLRVFDVNLRQHWYSREVIVDSLRCANVVKLNDAELPVLAEMLGLVGDADSVLGRMLELYDLRMAALTRGAHGSVLRTPHERVEHPGFPVEVADTVGAGDAFTAALVAGLLFGLEPVRINEIANRLGAYAASKPGATPPAPPELRRLFPRG